MEYPVRKHPRLKAYDYSTPGYYYVTIHASGEIGPFSKVGRGLAPAAAEVHLTENGRILYQQLLALESRYENVKIDRYVIMPNHIHVIIRLLDVAGASPRPTLIDVVCAFKSLTTRACNIRDGVAGRKIFQTSFYETVIRNETAYLETCRYIDNNPAAWLLSSDG